MSDKQSTSAESVDETQTASGDGTSSSIQETNVNATNLSPDAEEGERKERKESTDAAVETGQEVVADDNADIAELTRDMFQKMTAYLQGDLGATAEDYKLLEQMNMMTAKKYADMRNIALQIGDSMTGLQNKYQSLQPYLDQIDQVEESVTSLEQAALRLDAYSKRLEARFKQLEKR